MTAPRFFTLSQVTARIAEDVKEGARLIRDLEGKLKQVETEVADAFKELEEKEQ